MSRHNAKPPHRLSPSPLLTGTGSAVLGMTIVGQPAWRASTRAVTQLDVDVSGARAT